MTPTNSSIEKWLVDFMSDPANNTLVELPGPAFALPSVGFSRASDPLYPFYKDHIDPNFYRLPTEWLKSVYGREFHPENVSIISWVLPQTADTRAKSAASADCPTLEWQMARIHGEDCNQAMAKALQAYFRDLGYEAVAPMCAPDFSWNNSEKFTLISNWSERHTAFISGLGTFGLCDGLISHRGKAARYGSCIVNLPLEPTVRPYTRYNEYCLADKGCTACIDRCPAGAITKEGGHDKVKCQAYHKEFIAPLCHDRYGHEGRAVCGLCQTGVPCECAIPGKAK